MGGLHWSGCHWSTGIPRISGTRWGQRPLWGCVCLCVLPQALLWALAAEMAAEMAAACSIGRALEGLDQELLPFHFTSPSPQHRPSFRLLCCCLQGYLPAVVSPSQQKYWHLPLAVPPLGLSVALPLFEESQLPSSISKTHLKMLFTKCQSRKLICLEVLLLKFS